jgi:hypothetical protein
MSQLWSERHAGWLARGLVSFPCMMTSPGGGPMRPPAGDPRPQVKYSARAANGVKGIDAAGMSPAEVIRNLDADRRLLAAEHYG